MVAQWKVDCCHCRLLPSHHDLRSDQPGSGSSPHFRNFEPDSRPLDECPNPVHGVVTKWRPPGACLGRGERNEHEARSVHIQGAGSGRVHLAHRRDAAQLLRRRGRRPLPRRRCERRARSRRGRHMRSGVRRRDCRVGRQIRHLAQHLHWLHREHRRRRVDLPPLDVGSGPLRDVFDGRQLIRCAAEHRNRAHHRGVGAHCLGVPARLVCTDHGHRTGQLCWVPVPLRRGILWRHHGRDAAHVHRRVHAGPLLRSRLSHSNAVLERRLPASRGEGHLLGVPCGKVLQ